jgi:hypothetical protein
MKRILFLLALGVSALHGAEENVLSSLHRKVEVASPEAAAAWKFEKFNFEDWLTAISDPSWELLVSTQTTEFFFAAFRDGDHLIFWDLDRNARYRNTSTGTKPRWVGPSKVVTLEHEVSHPTGGFTHNAVARAYQMPADHDGSIEIHHTVTPEGGQPIQVFTTKVQWKPAAKNTAEPSTTKTDPEPDNSNAPQPEPKKPAP